MLEYFLTRARLRSTLSIDVGRWRKQNMTEQMTPKERWLAAILMKPVDRLPFWPKLGGAYPKAQDSPFCYMNQNEIHDWIGSDKHEGIPGCIRRKRGRTSVTTTRENGTSATVYRTSHGELHSAEAYDEKSDAWHPMEFPVKTLEDIKLMVAIEEDVALELDQESLDKAVASSHEIGDCALTFNSIGESPLMYWVEYLAGVENAHFLLADHQEEVETLFEALHANLVKSTELLCEHSPADVFYMVENTSTTLISPDQYRQYCARHVGEYAKTTDGAGRNLILHMCGHLKAVLPDLAQIPAQAFEAFTSPTLGNTSLLDGRTACPDQCLIGGTNAMLWMKTPDEIVKKIEEDLAELPHHRGVVVTSAGVMPPVCKPDTVKQVCEWVKQYPARMN
jgi:uroporphyrinogen-III decarboxylase